MYDADTIFIVFGPTEIDAAQKDTAIARATKTMQLLNRFNEIGDDFYVDDIDRDEANRLWKMEDLSPLAHLGQCVSDWGKLNYEYENEFEELAREDLPQIIVEQLIALWNHRKYDCTMFAVPETDDRKIAVAMEDPPHDRAFDILRYAWILGVFDILGLEECDGR